MSQKDDKDLSSGGNSGATISSISLPQVLHFLQVEWRNFESQRNEWEIEKSELKAKICTLEGSREGLEQMKGDLQRRVKMLEYSLKQERYNTDRPHNRMKNIALMNAAGLQIDCDIPVTNSIDESMSLPSRSTKKTNVSSTSIKQESNQSGIYLPFSNSGGYAKSREQLKRCCLI